MKVLVTGAAGFVGRHFYRHFYERGHAMRAVDTAYTLGAQDVRTFCRMPGHEPGYWDLVIHCAAVVGGRATIEGEPLRLACEDLSIDAELFSWAMRARPGRIVYFSSAAAYPVARQTGRELQLRELDIQLDHEVLGTPDQTYGWVKLTGERLAQEANAAGITTHVFRPFSGYGTDQALDYPFPSIIDRVRRREDPLTIWSNAVRDFVHIDDIVGAVLAAIDNEVLGPVNICNGRATSFFDLAAFASFEAGHGPVTIEIAEGMPTGVQYRVGDPTLMRTFYEPKVTLEEGVRRALNPERRVA